MFVWCFFVVIVCVFFRKYVLILFDVMGVVVDVLCDEFVLMCDGVFE